LEGIIKKILLVIFDGLADRPIPALGGKTPLQVAAIPNLNELAKRSQCGTQNALAFGEYPTSEEAHLAIFGYDYKKDLPGRGVLEGLGINAPLTKKDLVLRVDFGTVDRSLKVIDPRAGNINSVKSFCQHLGEIKIGNFTFNIYPGLGHRAVLSISGVPVSKEIKHHSTVVTDTDPHKSKVHQGGNRVLKPEPLDNSIEAKLTAEALWEYQKKTNEILNKYLENKIRIRSGLKPANFILTRGAGFIKPVESFHQKYQLNAVCVAGAPLYKGIARYLGMDVAEVPGATGTFETNIDAKVKMALLKLKEGYDFCFLHLKGTDVVAEEEGDYEKKIDYLERADKALKAVLNFKGVLAVTGDHATPCVLKDHSLDPVPFMISDQNPDSVTLFNEVDCAKGELGHFAGSEIMTKLIKESKNV
jgi:2,3-bisphosphoglycerate-independent phosphoglycerate mutase